MSIVQIILVIIGAALSGALFSQLRFPTACGIYFLTLGSMIYFAYRIEFVQANRQSSSEKFHGARIKMAYCGFLALFILVPVAIALVHYNRY